MVLKFFVSHFEFSKAVKTIIQKVKFYINVEHDDATRQNRGHRWDTVGVICAFVFVKIKSNFDDE